jgi:hypothetical protein
MIDHLARLGKAKADHAAAVARLREVNVVEPKTRPSKRKVPYSIEEARATLHNFEKSLRELKRSPEEEPIVDSGFDRVEMALMDLQAQKASIAEETRSGDLECQKKLVDMVVSLDEQAAGYQREIGQIEQRTEAQEKQYESELRRLLAKVAGVQQRRRSSDEHYKQVLKGLQDDIANVQTNFAEKMRNAQRIAQKLRTRLANASIRREGQLRGERERSGDTTRVLQENSALVIRTAQLEVEITLAKETLTAVRRELSATIGPRRTQSLFI